MAQISIEELMAVVKAHPDYKSKWEMDVPPEQAFYIEFTKPGPSGRRVKPEVFELANGADLALDRDSTGRIVGIEIL